MLHAEIILPDIAKITKVNQRSLNVSQLSAETFPTCGAVKLLAYIYFGRVVGHVILF